MSTSPSILDELRTQYEAARTSQHPHSDVEGYEQINARMRKAYAWLDKAVSYLDGVKPPIAHRFDVGHGMVFEGTEVRARLSSASTSERIVGFPVIDEISIWYEIAAARPLTVEVAPGRRAASGKGAGRRRAAIHLPPGRGSHAASCSKCVITVPPAIPAKVDVQRRLPDRARHGFAGQRRPLRPREPRVPQPGDRRVGARRPG